MEFSGIYDLIDKMPSDTKELITHSTIAELTIYINIYKEEQAAREKAEKASTRNPNPMAPRS